MDIWDEVVSEYNNELNKLRNNVSDGQAANFAHYPQLFGNIYEIDRSRNKLTEIVKKRLYEEEDD